MNRGGETEKETRGTWGYREREREREKKRREPGWAEFPDFVTSSSRIFA